MTQKFVSGTGYVDLTSEEQVEFDVNAAAHAAAAPQRAKEAKQEQINSDFTLSASALKNGYTEDEIKSWDKQETEAKAFTADPLATTPLLSAMVSTRGDTVAALAATILSNSAAWTAAYGATLGTKHAREAALAAIDLNAVDAIAQIEAI